MCWKFEIVTTFNVKCEKRKTTFGVVFIDLAKAFNSVSHSHIIMALKKKGVDQHIIALIKNRYHNSSTHIDLAHP